MVATQEGLCSMEFCLFGMDLGSCHPSGVWTVESASRFLENLWTPEGPPYHVSKKRPFYRAPCGTYRWAEGPPRTLACFTIKAHSALLFAFGFHLFTFCSHKSFSTSTSHLTLSLATFRLSYPCLIHFNHVPYHSNFSF
jgi:hypothetical protein